MEHPQLDMIALGIRQPWAELILRGHKSQEIRSSNTSRRGTIYVYASKKVSDHPEAIRAAAKHGIEKIDDLPRGVLVGTVELIDSAPARPQDSAEACLPAGLLKGKFAWTLSHPARLPRPMLVKYLPYGVWFYPYQRIGGRTKK